MMRQVASYTQAELSETEGDRIEWLETSKGIYLLVNEVELRRPTLPDWLRKSGRHFLARKFKGLFTRAPENRVLEIEDDYDWRKSGGRYDWRH
jgi:hypothetical protein